MLATNAQDPNPLKEMVTDNDNLLGFILDNQPTKADYLFVNNLLTIHAENNPTIRLAIQVVTKSNVNLNELFETLKLGFEAYNKSALVAIISPTSMKTEINIGQLSNQKMTVKYFATKEKASAFKWLLA